MWSRKREKITSVYENIFDLVNNQEIIIQIIMRYQFCQLHCKKEKKYILSKVANVWEKNTL